jgi:hypothetical protein
LSPLENWDYTVNWIQNGDKPLQVEMWKMGLFLCWQRTEGTDRWQKHGYWLWFSRETEPIGDGWIDECMGRQIDR